MTLPDCTLAVLRRRRTLPDERRTAGLDALVVLTAPNDVALLRRLPESPRWLGLHARGKPTALALRNTTLANSRQTFAQLAYVKAGASSFERLSLAGKLLRELAARRPGQIGFLVGGAVADAALWYEALLSAAWTESFALPVFRSRRPDRWRLKAIELYAAPTLDVDRIAASARAANLVRALTATPPNKLDAGAYRRALQELSRRHRLSLKWYSQSQLQRLGAGAFLAVARGNAARTAGIAHLRWRGGRSSSGRRGRSPDVALVGKGILFDTGGVNLKPHRSMLDMHTDMAGSAVALATLVALAELRAPMNADAWLAISENNIGPSAYRPQEVVRASNGTTIQVIHTDAEGRMVLADTLALAARTHPRLTIDFATLTGACVYALTERYSGVFTNRADLAPALVAAGVSSGERVWNFPLDEDFDSDLDSPVADIMQCSADGKGDHILAARFLKRFIGDDNPWVHVDLSSATRRGGLAHVGTEITGFGVRFALELLLTVKLQQHVKSS
ncbi:MAG TPA: leucyl aminopeptidase family protein [Steroidobacteraceae bacterium]|jgi:leucyl aminopeptidase|nr:leucyl aminopeptidase family protein [Steroidobacteraceae bacterium]